MYDMHENVPKRRNVHVIRNQKRLAALTAALIAASLWPAPSSASPRHPGVKWAWMV